MVVFCTTLNVIVSGTPGSLAARTVRAPVPVWSTLDPHGIGRHGIEHEFACTVRLLAEIRAGPKPAGQIKAMCGSARFGTIWLFGPEVNVTVLDAGSAVTEYGSAVVAAEQTIALIRVVRGVDHVLEVVRHRAGVQGRAVRAGDALADRKRHRRRTVDGPATRHVGDKRLAIGCDADQAIVHRGIDGQRWIGGAR